MERYIQLTADGSHTIAIPGMQVTYHSTHGAIQESRHVFIEAGLYHYMAFKRDGIRILEMGLGTGLNALLTLQAARQHSWPVYYHSLELYPLSMAEATALNYTTQLGDEVLFKSIHNSPWEEDVMLHPGFTLHKSRLSPAEVVAEPCDIIYYDAFAPDIQPELWTEAIFAKLPLKPGGILVTYSCKGVVRRALQAAGFVLTKLPGPPGKREILRAEKV